MRDEMTAYLRDYAVAFNLPIVTGAEAVGVARDECFRARARDGRTFSAHALVAASGGFGMPYLPQLPGQETFEGERLHSAD